MVLRSNIRAALASTGFVLLSVLFSCEKPLLVTCSECSYDEPVEAFLEISMEDIQGGTWISIYEGKLEDNVIFQKFISYSNDIFQKVPVNKMYTLSAEYNIDGKTYIVVNSVFPRVVFEEKQCNEPCYYVYDKAVNLKIRHY